MSPMQEQQPTYLVCNTADMPAPYADNVAARCALCGAAIYHRPHALRDLPRALPVCVPCAMRDVAAREATGEQVAFTATQRTLREVAAELKRGWARDGGGKRRGRKGRA